MERNNRWGFAQEYPQAPLREAVQAPVISNNINTVAVDTANKSVQLLEKVINDIRIENEKLKRENATLHSQVLNSNAKITTLEDALRASNERAESYKNATFADRYASGGYTVSSVCPEAATISARVHVPKTRAATIAQEYRTPVNPMTVFVEFLEEMDILEEYVQKTVTENVSFTVLCAQFMPSEFISAVCVDEDDELLEEWEEAHAIWEAMCETDDLDSKEAYVE